MLSFWAEFLYLKNGKEYQLYKCSDTKIPVCQMTKRGEKKWGTFKNKQTKSLK